MAPITAQLLGPVAAWHFRAYADPATPPARETAVRRRLDVGDRGPGRRKRPRSPWRHHRRSQSPLPHRPPRRCIRRTSTPSRRDPSRRCDRLRRALGEPPRREFPCPPNSLCSTIAHASSVYLATVYADMRDLGAAPTPAELTNTRSPRQADRTNRNPATALHAYGRINQTLPSFTRNGRLLDASAPPRTIRCRSPNRAE